MAPPINTSTLRSALIGLLVLTLAGCSLGDSTGSAGTDNSVTAEAAADQPSTGSASNAAFDATYVHDISVSFDEAAYDDLVQAYQDSGEKVWIEATVTIDGETYESAGIRLKGNSSLRGLGGGGFGPGGPGGLGDESGDVSEPEGLPWLIKLDKYVEGQNHDGVHDFVVRSNNSQTSLNEAVALELLELAGLASQDAMYVRFTVNDSAAALRLVIEHPDDVWMADNFGDDGALYKAEASGSYDYRGDDAEAYDEVFDQEAGKDNTDLSPLIDFLDFINNSDDATFEEELDDRFDVDAFATYLAMQELIGNFDDIDGPGNNSYLYYDADSGKFTVVAWDHNLAFGGFGNLGGGGRGFPGGDGGVPEGAPGFPGGDGEGVPSDLPGFPGGDGAEGLPEDFDGNRPGGFGGGGFGPGGSNVLVERFLANEEWSDLYEQRLAELTDELVADGTAGAVLDQWVDLLVSGAADLVDRDTVEQEAEQIAASLAG